MTNSIFDVHYKLLNVVILMRAANISYLNMANEKTISTYCLFKNEYDFQDNIFAVTSFQLIRNFPMNSSYIKPNVKVLLFTMYTLRFLNTTLSVEISHTVENKNPFTDDSCGY